VRTPEARVPDGWLLRSAVHLAMALGMAAMLLPAAGGAVPESVLRVGFGGLAVLLGLDWGRRRLRGRAAARSARQVGHRLHHAAMFGIMALMATPTPTPTPTLAGTGGGSGATGMRAGAGAMQGMAMPQAGGGPSAVLLAAFGYVCVFALVFAWRIPALAGESGTRSSIRRGGGGDPLGHGCEIVMLVSAAVMLLPLV
jgi:hypothetical protein